MRLGPVHAIHKLEQLDRLQHIVLRFILSLERYRNRLEVTK
jgi:hypothetical protein